MSCKEGCSRSKNTLSEVCIFFLCRVVRKIIRRKKKYTILVAHNSEELGEIMISIYEWFKTKFLVVILQFCITLIVTSRVYSSLWSINYRIKIIFLYRHKTEWFCLILRHARQVSKQSKMFFQSFLCSYPAVCWSGSFLSFIWEKVVEFSMNQTAKFSFFRDVVKIQSIFYKWCSRVILEDANTFILWCLRYDIMQKM